MFHLFTVNIINPSVLTPTKAPETKDTDNDSLRICEYCLHLLNNRKDMQDSRSYRPTITVYYEKIQDLKQSITPDIATYNRMIASLYDGDSIFTLVDASALRGKIGRVAEQIDAYSKAILNIPPIGTGPREESLKKKIRLACINYIKDEMISLDPLPNEAEIKQRQQKRKRETEQRIEMERRLAQEALERFDSIGGNGSSQQPSAPWQGKRLDKFASGVSTFKIKENN